MKKIKFIFFNTIIIIFVAAFFASAAEVKNTSAATTAVPIKAAPAVMPTQIKQSSTTPAANVSPAVTPTQIKPPPVSPGTNVTPAATLTPIQQPQPGSSPVDTYSYNPSGKPDPFRPFIVVETVPQKKSEKKEAVSMFPLQRAATENYRVVGIAGNGEHRVAIAEDSSKKFYPLFPGTRIGLNNGKVIEIMADRVIVEEYEGKKAKRVILKLRKN
ncbi:MAG: pilus assembly protein PilP [Deltaproteobacteria bacterium]|nr:pilus assembly protein PilP [Deltaproteobacteria bacterium]